jgi:nitrogen fixation protein FixH
MHEDSDYQPKGRPLTGGKVLAMLLAFFGVMLAVNAYMARQAIATHPGLDHKNAYEAGVAFNKEIAAARAQTELGWSVGLTRVKTGAATQVTAIVKDQAGQPVNGLVATLRFDYPSTSHRDKDVPAAAAGDGVYSGVAELTPGHWNVEIEFARDGQRVFRSKNSFDVE